jgi:hypothetical protein
MMMYCFLQMYDCHRFSIPAFQFQFRSNSNSNSDFNSTQSYLLIEHQELLILPFHITSSMRVYVTENEEDDASNTSSVPPSPLILFKVDDKKPPNRPLRRDFNQKIASKLSEAKALMTFLECRIEREVRRYASRWKIQNTIMKTHHFPF